MDYRWYTLGLDLGQRQDFTALALLETQLWLPPQQIPQPQPLGGVGYDEMLRVVQETRPRPVAAKVTPGWQSPVGHDLALLDAAVNGKYGHWPSKPHVHVRHLKRFPLGTSYPDVVSAVGDIMSKPPLSRLGVTLVIDGTGVGTAVTDMFVQAGLDPVAITITGGVSVNHDEYGWRTPKRDLVGTVTAMLQTRRLHIARELPDAAILQDELLNFRVTIDPKTAHDSYAAWRERDHDDLVLALAMAAWYRDAYWQHYDHALLPEPQAV